VEVDHRREVRVIGNVVQFLKNEEAGVDSAEFVLKKF